MNTIVAFSTRSAMRKATTKAPAAEIPQKIPSSLAKRLVMSSAAA
jgi:hypothetical protein